MIFAKVSENEFKGMEREFKRKEEVNFAERRRKEKEGRGGWRE